MSPLPWPPAPAPSGPRKRATCCSSLRVPPPPPGPPLPAHSPGVGGRWAPPHWAVGRRGLGCPGPGLGPGASVFPNPVGRLQPACHPSAKGHSKERETEAGAASSADTSPSCPGPAIRCGLHVPALGRVAWGTWVRPPQVGGVPCPATPAPQPREESAGRVGAAGDGGDARARPRAPHSPRSAPLRAHASARLRARPSAVQGSIPRNRPGARTPRAPRWLAPGRHRASPHWPARDPPPKAPPRGAHSAGAARARRDPAAHSWARLHTDTAAFL